MVADALLIALFILVGGMFAAAEMALVTLRDSQVRQLAGRGKRGRAVERLAGDPNRFLSAVQIGVTVSGFLSAAFGGATLAAWLRGVFARWGLSPSVGGPLALVLVTLVIAYFSIVVGELTAKRLAMQRAEGFSLALAPLIDGIATLFRPLIWFLGRSTNALVRLLGGDPNLSRDAVTDEELRAMVVASSTLGVEERTIVDEVFDAGERSLREVMVPRTEVDFLPAEMPIALAYREVRGAPHSRYPVIDGSPDKIIGFLHVRDLMDVEGAARGGEVRGIVREVMFLPETVKILRALTSMRGARSHMAIVRDEYGGTAGIVTLEDLMEELIGDITDEYDVPVEAPHHEVDEVDGLTTIEEFAELTGYVIPEGPYDTVAGYFMATIGTPTRCRRGSPWRPPRWTGAAPPGSPCTETGARMPDDGMRLLTGPRVAPLLRAAMQHQGGELVDWSLDHVDAAPEHSTTATYVATVRWPHGERTELLGVSARTGELSPSDERADIFEDGHRRVAVWLYPNDPDLLGLPRAAYPDKMAETLNAGRVLARPVTAEQLSLSMIGYRPRRRAVVKVVVNDPHQVFYVKVLRERVFADVYGKHTLLRQAGIPAPEVALTTDDHLLVLRELPGTAMAKALFEPGDPCTAEDLIGLLDAMPAAVAGLERRPPWSDAVAHYAGMVAATLPEMEAELGWLTEQISGGLSRFPLGTEPTHGDFHEGQLRTAGGRIVGVLDVDTIGPGRRADDLACLIGHLSTIQRMNPQQEAKVRDLLARWVPVFDRRVDPVELRLRAAAVVISLATGPYRSQEVDWRQQTVGMIRSAMALVRQVC